MILLGFFSLTFWATLVLSMDDNGSPFMAPMMPNNNPMEPTSMNSPMNPNGMQPCPACVPCTEEGRESRLASGYYLCKNGRYELVACSADDGTRVEPGSTYTRANYYFIFECQRSSIIGDGAIKFTPIACKQGDKSVKAGETFVMNMFWYQCFQKTPGTLAFEARGCVHDESGEHVRANSTYKTKDFVYFCYLTPDGAVYSQPQGCVVDGKEYPIDADVDSESKSCWYRCYRTPDGLQLRVMGCLEGGRKYEVGQNIPFGDYLYKCIRNAADESITREPIGCTETIRDGTKVEHRFGEQWTEGDDGGSNPKYVYECRGDSKSVSKAPVQCVYDGPDGQGRLDGGCMRRFGRTVLQCFKGGSGVHGMIVPNAGDEFESMAKPTGLRVC